MASKKSVFPKLGSILLFPNWEILVILQILMRILSKPTVIDAGNKYPEARGQFAAWYDFVKHADWRAPADIQKDFGPDSVLPNNIAVFNIKGNKYRIVVRINYEYQKVFIRFIGTHKEYNEIDVATI